MMLKNTSYYKLMSNTLFYQNVAIQYFNPHSSDEENR